MKTIRWGILGAGNIVKRWMKGARQPEGMEIVAIASRTKENAQLAAASLGIPEALTYEELVTRNDIDAVYIAVPHPAHLSMAILAMEHGKAVLVEKPIAVNAQQLQQMLDCAKKNNVFLMEAVWTRFFPLIDKVYNLIGDGEGKIGEIRAIQTAFSSRVSTENLKHRVFNPELAGGGLLDIGVYNLHLCDLLLDKSPKKLIGLATIDSDDHHIQVDEQAMYLAQYDNGALASMASGVRTKMRDTAYIYGTNGYIELPEFWRPKHMKVTIGTVTTEYHEAVLLNNTKYEDEGFRYELDHMNECLRMGLLESPIMTWERSMRVMQQCDELRRQWGLQYPFENELFAFIEYFKDTTPEAGEVSKFYRLTDGYPEYNARFSLFIEQVYKSGLMREDYLDYLSEFPSLENRKNLIQNADLQLIRALLTYYVRGERFSDGFWKDAINEGAYLAILLRLQQLL